MRSSVIKFLKMCKQFAEDYGSEIKNDENMIINTCYNNYKIILPNRTIKKNDWLDESYSSISKRQILRLSW